MSFVISLDKWSFFKDVNDLKRGRKGEEVILPHTWNAMDGQDGGNGYGYGDPYGQDGRGLNLDDLFGQR